MPLRFPHPAILASAALLGVTAAVALHARHSESGDDRPVATPLLTAPILCAQPRAPGQRAQDLARSAEAKLDGRWVVLGSGPVAWSMLAEAALCGRAAGDHALATALETRATTLRTALEADHRLRDLRLQHALERGDLDQARAESLQLLSLRGQRTDAYDVWLRRIAEAGAP